MSYIEKTLYLDFEFNDVTESPINLVSCVSWDVTNNDLQKWWLHKDKKAQEKLRNYILDHGYNRLVSYAAVAEARSLIALAMDVLKLGWIDLFFEYRCLTNHNDRLQWGNQLVDGVVKKVFKPKPKWERTEEDAGTGFRAKHSLAEATYKLLGVIRDTEHKTKMRNLIISASLLFTLEEQAAILDYGVEDVQDLPALEKETIRQYQILDPKINLAELEEEMLLRGRYAAHTAIMEDRGYPIDYDKLRNFSNQVGNILFDCQRDINNLFPGIKPFRWDRKDNKFKWDQTATREWIKKNHVGKNWMQTDGGDVSLALDAWTKYYDFKHNYPTDNFGAQMVRFLKLKQSLNGFVPSSDPEKRTFWSSVGKDKRVRAYMNPYGAQSSRTQPGATGFLFLKPAWQRALCLPNKGRACGGIDYGSEEFFIQALESGDKNMIDAYLSGDPYLSFGKIVGAIPKDGTKESHPVERDLFKQTILGLSYLMSKYGLAIKLTQDTGREWTEDEAQEQIDLFYEAFPELKEYQEWIIKIYTEDRHIQLKCGWYCWGDNDNFRSVTNVPVQGFGASIMRKAVDLAVERGLEVIFTLHDAIYIEYAVSEEYKMKILHECMLEAFQFYFTDPKKKTLAGKIKLDAFAWSPDYEKDSEIIVDGFKLPVSNLYIDSRSQVDYDLFGKYFNSQPSDAL